jgi:8-oxo-dGTP diphosphatase
MRTTFPLVSWVFLRQSNHVLQVRRANTGFEDGNYAPVGGHLESRETVKEAAVREAQEEVGVQIDKSGLQPLGGGTLSFLERGRD